jgi:DNA-binding CsgD family transcriptional regulator/PAS domain-containing protein
LVPGRKETTTRKGGSRKARRSEPSGTDLAHSHSQRQGESGAVFETARAIVDSASVAAVSTDDENVVRACNRAAVELLGGSPRTILGRNFQDLTEARDIFGNRLSRDHGAFHDMVKRFEAVQSFKLDILGNTGQHQRVGVSVIVVTGPGTRGHFLVYLLTPMKRRRRADQLIDQILIGTAVGRSATYVGEQARGAVEACQLTPRQAQVLQLLAEGRRAPEIAKELKVSIHTVRSHIQNTLRVLEVSNQLEAVSKAVSLRLI